MPPPPPSSTQPRGGLPGSHVHAVWFAAEEWCDFSIPVAGWICQKFYAAPVFNLFLVADVVGLWFIAAILLRQREQDREVRRRRAALPRVCRVRRDWAAVATVARLSSLAAAATAPKPSPAQGRRPIDIGAWQEAWGKVAEARAHRKEYLRRVDFNISAVMTRWSGPLCMFVVLLAFAFEAHAFYTVALPWWALSPWLEEAVRYLGLVPLFRLLVDYASASFTDPGSPVAAGAAGAASEATELELGPGLEQRRCRVCGGPKPARSHHCKICRRCIIKMDHHCPFINNCVGLRNHRAFCLFLLDLVLCCAILVIALGPQAVRMLYPLRRQRNAHRVHVLVSAGIPLFWLLILAPFLIFHLQLILMNETTLEFISRRSRRGRKAREAGQPDNGYSRGVLENFAEVCGAPPAVCRRRVERVFEFMVPAHVSKLAKRNA